MYLLSQHLNNPILKTKLNFFNASSSITINGIDYNLYIDINNKDKIQKALPIINRDIVDAEKMLRSNEAGVNFEDESLE